MCFHVWEVIWKTEKSFLFSHVQTLILCFFRICCCVLLKNQIPPLIVHSVRALVQSFPPVFLTKTMIYLKYFPQRFLLNRSADIWGLSFLRVRSTINGSVQVYCQFKVLSRLLSFQRRALTFSPTSFGFCVLVDFCVRWFCQIWFCVSSLSERSEQRPSRRFTYLSVLACEIRRYVHLENWSWSVRLKVTSRRQCRRQKR